MAAVVEAVLPEIDGLAKQQCFGAGLVRKLQKLRCRQRPDHYGVERAGKDIAPAQIRARPSAEQQCAALRSRAAQDLGGDLFDQIFLHGASIPRSPLTKPQALASS